jgi:predicted transcriptional regulator
MFHALPVVENGELVGIVTPFDILKILQVEKPPHPEDVYEESK